VDADITYSIRITNTGADSLSDIVLTSPIPANLEFKKAKGPSAFIVIEKEIVFDTLPILQPKSEAHYEIVFRAIKEGDVWFKARVSTPYSERGEQGMEHTKVMRDPAESARAYRLQRPRFKSYIRSIDKNEVPIFIRLTMPKEDAYEGFWRNQSHLRCAIVALAVERYRIAHHHWPDSLSSVVPDFLVNVPLDP
jgi:hypothetical protein